MSLPRRQDDLARAEQLGRAENRVALRSPLCVVHVVAAPAEVDPPDKTLPAPEAGGAGHHDQRRRVTCATVTGGALPGTLVERVTLRRAFPDPTAGQVEQLRRLGTDRQHGADRLAKKRRPAVVVSGPDVAAAGFVWIVMITSARNAAAAGDLPIRDLATAGLAVASVVRPHKIACLEPSRIVRAIGALRPDAATEVYARLHSMIGTDPTDPRSSRASEPAP